MCNGKCTVDTSFLHYPSRYAQIVCFLKKLLNRTWAGNRGHIDKIEFLNSVSTLAVY
jgi:hypothetical protein